MIFLCGVFEFSQSMLLALIAHLFLLSVKECAHRLWLEAKDRTGSNLHGCKVQLQELSGFNWDYGTYKQGRVFAIEITELCSICVYVQGERGAMQKQCL